MNSTQHNRQSLWRTALLFTTCALTLSAGQALAGSDGPDVTVSTLYNLYKSSTVGDVVGYHVGTESCNIGDTPLWWCPSDEPYCDADQHPVIAQNIFRLKDDRFEQIGMSWLKHGFWSLNSGGQNSNCGPGNCALPPHDQHQLGIGCTDIYTASLNASRPLGMRSEIDATAGTLLEYPYTPVSSPTAVDQRAQVLVGEVDPLLNDGALYWVEGQYIAADDAAADNALNNASYRKVTVANDLSMSFDGSTVREVPAIAAWAAVDPEVSLVHADIDNGSTTTRFHIARKVLPGGPEGYHYEYAIRNMNEERGAQAFMVAFSGPASISGVGFRDVDHHSGEPYETTDWDVTVDGAAGTVSWATDTFATDPDANALRWGTMFSFWFDSSLAPAEVTDNVITLFKPGRPDTVGFTMESSILFANGFETGDTSGW